MSTLSVHDILGISSYSNTVRIPSGNTFSVDGSFAVGGAADFTGSLNVPVWTDGTRPVAPTQGSIGFNSTTGKNYLEVYDGNEWKNATEIDTGLYGTATLYAPLENDDVYTFGVPYIQGSGSPINNCGFGQDESITQLTVLKADGSGMGYKLPGFTNPGSSHTISVWFRSNDTADYGMLFSKANDLNDTAYNLDIWDGNGNNNIYNNNGDGYNNPYSGSGSHRFNHSDWKHYAFVNDGTSSRYYRDGALIGTSTTYRSFVNHLGSWSVGSWSGQYFGSYGINDGRWRKFAVWNGIAKSAGDILDLYNAGVV
jgi:hypothetical protein